MKISSKGRYGLRAMLELSRKNGIDVTSAKSISEEQGIPMAYLERILYALHQAGLVESVRGPGGGYKLRKLPSEISIGDILRALEGPIVISKCLLKNECNRINDCIARVLLKRLSNKFEQVLDEVSLEDILGGKDE
ncbi:Rrf2 family transcriptional regulator [candidate division WOR-3 bacterium]|nr:Rrf2 family transcriptional regulator [candidate division WOR-3 bacterium]